MAQLNFYVIKGERGRPGHVVVRDARGATIATLSADDAEACGEGLLLASQAARPPEAKSAAQGIAAVAMSVFGQARRKKARGD